MFVLSKEALNLSSLRSRQNRSGGGAVVEFEGVVRDHNEGRQVARLEYEAFGTMAEKEGQRILEDARQKFDVLDIACVHRVGLLEVGETAVWVGVVSAHRGDAFAACRFVIDEIKERVPLWKKEHYADQDARWLKPKK